MEPATGVEVSAMTRRSQLRNLEGRRVSLALVDGSRLDDCQLVSGGRRGAESVWVFTNGGDAFIPLGCVVDVWEVL